MRPWWLKVSSVAEVLPLGKDHRAAAMSKQLRWQKLNSVMDR